MRDSPKVVYRGNAKKNWNNNSSFKTSGDLPYENNGENVHPNSQPQNPSQNITNDPDEDDDNTVIGKYIESLTSWWPWRLKIILKFHLG